MTQPTSNTEFLTCPHWERVTPFFAYPPEVRRVLYTTNAIESLNMRLRKIIKTRGHFPSDEAATKLLYAGAEEHHRGMVAIHPAMEGSASAVRHPVSGTARSGLVR